MSKKFQLNKADVKKWLNNTLVFAAPALLVFFSSIQAGVPLKDALGAVYLWLLNTVIDLLKKYLQGSK